MESQPESTWLGEWARSVDPVVWPAITAVLVGGVLLLCTLIGMFWLVSRTPNQPPIVIWMPAPTANAPDNESAAVTHAAIAQENHRDARAN